MYPDEAMNGNNAVEAAETNHFQAFYTDNNGREGLYIDLVAVIMRLSPVYEPWAVRLPAAVAGVLTVCGLYLLAGELFGEGAGLFAAFLLAASFWHINFSRIAFRAILAPLFLVWALYLLIRAFKQNPSAGAWWYAIGAGAVYALGFYSYTAYRITPLLLLLFIPFFRKYPQFWKRASVFMVSVLICVMPIGSYFLRHRADFFGRIAEISVARAPHPLYRFAVNTVKEMLMFNFHGDENWRHNISGAPELFIPVGVLFLLGIILGIYYLFRRMSKRQVTPANERLFEPFGVWLLFAMLVFGILPAAATIQGVPHAVRSILALPPAMILAALGGVWLNRLIRKHWGVRPSLALAVIFIVIIGTSSYYDYFVVWAKNLNVSAAFRVDYVAIAERINDLPKSAQKYVIVSTSRTWAHGIPVKAETTMFLTHSFTATDDAAANIHYLTPGHASEIPTNTPRANIFFID
jgi:4-amino-4-deoxy-L-arabinose transferase-like glycosyltransferase